MKQPLDVLVVSALNRELAPLCRRLRARPTATQRPRVYRARAGNRDVFLAAVGVGRENARDRLASVIEAARPGYVLGLGFGGALDPRLDIGDLIACRRVCVVEAPKADARVEFWQSAMVAGLDNLAVKVRDCVTVGGLVGSLEVKIRLGRVTGAYVCDMETSAWVNILNTTKLPYAIVRAVSDRVDQDVTIDFSRFVNKKGRISRSKVAAHLFVNPTVFGRVSRLWWTSRRAARSLARFAGPLLENPDWPAFG